MGAMEDLADGHHRHELHRQVMQLAAKYVGWQEPGGASHDPRRLAAQVMELGTHEDAEALRLALGDGALREVLQNAAPGWLSAKSWHYALGLAAYGQVPAQPQRRYE